MVGIYVEHCGGRHRKKGDACAMQISSQSPAIESEFHTILYVWIHENFAEIHTLGGKSDKTLIALEKLV